jgi:2-dehydro-3-deoxyglucarate aldolase/4-hydroxy-2-oxoheptanedioate aldolase
MRANRVKHALEGGGVAAGVFAFDFGTVGLPRIAAAAGAEFLVLDQEHTGWTLETAKTIFAAARAHDVVPMVRVPSTQYHLIAHALDVGAMGVMVPMVESAGQAREIVASAKYPPLGRRGVGLLYSDQVVDGSVPATLEAANREVLVIAQIETAAGVENVEAIAAVDGIDVLWIGHFDLTASLGIPGEFESPRFREAVDRVLAACLHAGKPLGIMVTTPQDGLRVREEGFRAIGYGDIWLFENALRAGIEAVRD